MPLVFDPGQPHQRRAIEAIVASLEGQGPAAGRHADHVGGRVVHGNRLPWSYEALEQRVRAHQAREGLDVEGAAWMRDPTDPSAVPFPTLSVEMETGTGKTYVFLRTALELATRVGWRKFVVVVPSVAIREGVLATLRATRSHFAALYPDVPYRFFAYERERMHAVLRFAESPDVELAVLTIDAFNRERNVFRRPHDRCGGASPMQWWQAIHPVLLVDEAHHVETPLRIRAVAELQPCCALRYGATHRRRAGLVHRLSAAEAHRRGLVKTIEVVPCPRELVAAPEARFAAQLEGMIAAHLQRQRQWHAQGIKVLSLVFLERVDDYLDDGAVARAFDACFDRLKVGDPHFAHRTAASVRAAYFAPRRGAGPTAGARAAYDLLLRDKERLLRFDEPVAFVFSHSALREGWDNPNIFQICTLARAHSPLRKRQEIGRGIRLAVDQRGVRVPRPDVQVLRVFANESYEAYVAALQQETEPCRRPGETFVPPRRATPEGGAPGGETEVVAEAPAPWLSPAERLARARDRLAAAWNEAELPPARRFAEASPTHADAPLPNLVDVVLRLLGSDANALLVTRGMVIALLAEVRPRARFVRAPMGVATRIAAALRDA